MMNMAAARLYNNHITNHYSKFKSQNQLLIKKLRHDASLVGGNHCVAEE